MDDSPSMESLDTEAIAKLLESQRQLVHTQLDQFHNIVDIQCKLTGVNPLSQEMAADALSIKIGKRPRDMLNPKAVKYMQSVFSIKDAISKKELREIGALFGVTVTQVRDYFNNQRSRVRRIVKSSRDTAINRANIDREIQQDMPESSNRMQAIDPVPLSSVGPSNAEDVPSCSNQDEVLPGLGESEKQFVENIFSLMRKEETFSGQEKLLEWILLIENPAVLCWFLTKGGVMILATWLSEAASEEQTTVLSVILKVLSHLPLIKALPTHMSAILQAVNKLRFYQVSDISNRARVLLSKWSKMLSKSPASRKPNGIKLGSAEEINLRQRIGELIGDDSWQPSRENHEGALVTSYCGANDTRKMEAQQDVKLLTASSDDSNKKLMLGASSIQNKERRTVLLVEQPGQKQPAKSQPVRPVAASQARPITADEIRKAKLREQLMQQNSKTKGEGSKRPLLANDFLSASEAYLRPKLEAQKKARVIPPKITAQVDSVSEQKSAANVTKEPTPEKEPTPDKRRTPEKEPTPDKRRTAPIPWRMPPEFEVNAAWEIGTGGSSKEVEVQKNRTRREKETTYQSLQEVPPNPKEPWDMEMDYDDSLTPEIPIEQLPDAEDVEMTDAPLNPPSIPPLHNNPNLSSSTSASSVAEPDIELLAVLLKNPDLVFALTKGQAGLSSEDTIRFLDILKANGGELLGGLNKPSVMMETEKQKVELSLLPSLTPHRNMEVEVSLPSPTPPSRFDVSLPSPTPASSSNPGPSGWATQAAAVQNPFSRHSATPLPGLQQTAVISSDNSRLVQNSNTTLPPFLSPQIPTVNSASYVASSLPAAAVFQAQVHPQPRLPDPSPYGAHEAPVVNSRHGPAVGTASSFSARGDPNAYDHRRGPLPAPSRERSDFYRGARSNGWGPEENYPDQRGRGYSYGHSHDPLDRHHASRHHNLHAYRDQNWYAGGSSGGGGSSGRSVGGGNRRWHESDRRW